MIQLIYWIWITDDLPVLYGLRASCMQTHRQREEQHQQQYLQPIGCVGDTKKYTEIIC